MDELSLDATTAAGNLSLAGRYTLEGLLGSGAFGSVHLAQDALLDRRVAVKLLRPMPPGEEARVRREIAALRMLPVQGVVQLLDEGVQDGQIFIVTDFVEGRPFPTGRTAWTELEATVTSLLETLSRVHDAGLMHRDLKPANVLVDDSGRPCILDFGLARGVAEAKGLTATGMILGTPAYLAPEQALGERVDTRADLFAVGVMIFGALTGHLPHSSRDLRATLLSRVTQPAPSLFDMDVDAPSHIRRLVDRLLARAPELRPQSCSVALEALRSGAVASLTSDGLPWLGPSDLIQALVKAGRAGRRLAFSGQPGTGRSRALRECARQLGEEGYTLSWCRGGPRPFSAFPFLDTRLQRLHDSTLGEVGALIQGALSAALGAGEVILVDDFAELDPWSRSALDKLPGPGALLSLRGEAELCTRTLDQADLEPLFVGPSRVFHLPEDAAEILWQRTKGHQGRVAREVEAWVQAGLAAWSGPRLAIEAPAWLTFCMS